MIQGRGLSPSVELLFQQLRDFACFSSHGNTSSFEGGNLFFCRAATTRDDGSSVSHLFAFRCFAPRYEGGNGFSYVSLDVFGSSFLSVSANLANDGNAIRFGVVLEHFE